MRYEDWEIIKFEDVAEVNPRTTLKKGTIARKVAMEHVKEFTRKIAGYEEAEYKSGSKFQNEDTLFARITPCLENGKTAYVDILNDNEVAFGSTEFYVLRVKEGISDSKFIYYLSTSDEFRKMAIQSMTGTSGRQRAQKDSLLNYEFKVPKLHVQERIGSTLSLFDEKIELNNSIIANLEELAQTLFKRWFVDFEFPNEEGKPYKSSGGKMVESELGMIPEGWEVGRFSELYSVKSGYAFKSAWWSEAGVPVIKIKDIENNTINNADLSFVSFEKSELASNFKVNSGDILIALTGATAGKFALIPKFDIDLLVNQRVGKFYYNDDNLSVSNSAYLFGLLLQQEFINRIIDLGSGSAQSNISPTNIAKMKVILPDKKYFNMFNADFSGLIKFITELSYENEKLIDIRDTLLPKLLLGEIELLDHMEVTDDVPIS